MSSEINSECNYYLIHNHSVLNCGVGFKFLLPQLFLHFFFPFYIQYKPANILCQDNLQTVFFLPLKRHFNYKINDCPAHFYVYFGNG